MSSRAMAVGLGAAYVAVATLSPLVLKTTPSDLDLFLWPAAERVVSGHPLLIYSAQAHGAYLNDNGPLGVVPLIPAAALANALGWAGNLARRAALAGVFESLVVLLLTYQVVRFIAAARAGPCRPVGVAATVLLAPALWIGLLDYGHVEQPVELCLILFAVTCTLRTRTALTGTTLGAALLSRTIAAFAVIPLLLARVVTRGIRPVVLTASAMVVTVLIVLAPFVLADPQAVIQSLITSRGALPIAGGSFWIVAQHATWSGLVREGDVYFGVAAAAVLVAIILRSKPALATTRLGLIGLLTVASCCCPLFAKTVFPYYLVEPYVFAVIWWLARPGSAINWRVSVPLLLSIDVFVVMWALTPPSDAWGVAASLTSSAALAAAITLVTFDLLHAPAAAVASEPLPHGARHEYIAMQEAK